MADLLDILTLTEGYDAVNLEAASGQDAKLAQFITGISRRVDDRCGPVVARTVTGELHDGGHPAIWLRETPVVSVTEVVEYDNTTATTLTAESNTVKPDGGYRLESRGHFVRLTRRAGNATQTFTHGFGNVSVTYEAGRAATTAAVDAKFKLAAASILRRLWHREAAAWARGGNPFAEAGVGTVGFFKAMDPMIDEFLADELLPPAVA